VKNKTAPTVGGIIAAFATIAGIWADAPQMIADLASGGPDWMLNPDVLWTISIVVIYGLCLAFIWRSPGQSLNTILYPECLLLDEFREPVAAIRRTADAHRESPEEEMNLALFATGEYELEGRMAAFLQSLLGTRERDKYLRVVRKAKDESDPLAMIEVAQSYLHGRTSSLLNERVEELRSRIHPHIEANSPAIHD